MVASLVWTGLGLGFLMLLVIAAMVFLMPRVPTRYRVDRRRVPCPADGKTAQVDFVVWSEDGEAAVDVLRCSHRPGEMPVACGRECRSLSVAPFAGRLSMG